MIKVLGSDPYKGSRKAVVTLLNSGNKAQLMQKTCKELVDLVRRADPAMNASPYHRVAEFVYSWVRQLPEYRKWFTVADKEMQSLQESGEFTADTLAEQMRGFGIWHNIPPALRETVMEDTISNYGR